MSPAQSIQMKNSAQSGEGSLFYVGGSGPGNYSKIQDAIDNASDGDTVFVYDDLSPYYENIVIRKSIYLIGEERQTTIIDGRKSCKVMTVFANNVTITGFTIRNSGVLVIDCAIECRSSHNTISGNIISNNSQGICFYTIGSYVANENNITGNMITSNKGPGVSLYHSQDNVIFGNIFTSNEGLVLDQSNNNTLSSNEFLNDGIWLNSYPNNILPDNYVNGKPLIYMVSESNEILDTAGQVILIDCYNITIRQQDLSNTTTGLTLIGTDNCFIEQNKIMNNYDFGINLFDSNKNNISLNTISDNSAGLQVTSSEHNTIIGNRIRSNPYWGIQLRGSNNNVILTNIIEKNGGRKLVENGLGLFLASSSNNSIIHNNFLKNARDAYFYEAYSTEWNSNYWSRPRIFPKIIPGETERTLFDKRINIDWRPAKTPYDIPILSGRGLDTYKYF
jgi:parallel beta-helix repeat protein